jgi:membrane protease YdiL (CAAX protease family)
MTPAKLIVILVFSLVVRGGTNVALKHLFVDSNSINDLISQIAFLLSIYLGCIKEFGLGKQALVKIFGLCRSYELLWAAILAVVLLMFTFGESAVQAILMSRYDLNFAYRWGNFHEEAYPSLHFFSLHVGAFLVASIIIPAFIEEFFFRGLLVRAFCVRKSFVQSALISSVIFTALHPSGGVYVSCFMCALAACFMYARTGSLYPCITMHATYNLLAFISQHYFDFHRTRSIDHLSSWTDWIPQITMLLVSLMTMTWWWFKYRNSILQSKFALATPYTEQGSRPKVPTQTVA